MRLVDEKKKSLVSDVYRQELSALPAALADYKLRHGELPRLLTVGKGKSIEARAILKGGVKVLAVQESGGCLANEFWLGR